MDVVTISFTGAFTGQVLAARGTALGTALLQIGQDGAQFEFEHDGKPLTVGDSLDINATIEVAKRSPKPAPAADPAPVGDPEED